MSFAGDATYRPLVRHFLAWDGKKWEGDSVKGKKIGTKRQNNLTTK